MKIECEICHVVAEIGETVARPGGMDVRCTACGRWFSMKSDAAPAEIPAAAPSPVDGRPGSGPYRAQGAGPGCPKCGRARATGDACPRCGLVYQLWPADAPQALVLDETGQALWAEIERAWSDLPRHDAFLKHCISADLLPGAGRQYRDRLDRHPGDAIAARMQERIVAAASQFLGVHAQPSQAVTRSRWFPVAMLVAGVVGAIAALVFG